MEVFFLKRYYRSMIGTEYCYPSRFYFFEGMANASFKRASESGRYHKVELIAVPYSKASVSIMDAVTDQYVRRTWSADGCLCDEVGRVGRISA